MGEGGGVLTCLSGFLNLFYANFLQLGKTVFSC